MLVTIIQTFDEGRRWFPGDNPDVDVQVARRWIAEGKATTDQDGAQQWSPAPLQTLVSLPTPSGVSAVDAIADYLLFTGATPKDLSAYFRTNKRFADLPPGYSYFRRWVPNNFTGVLTDEETGATATATGSPVAVANPYIVSRKGFTYNGTTQFHTLASAADTPFTLATPWTMTFTFTPNVTRSGGAKTYDLLNTRLTSGTTRGVEVALRWDGVSVTQLQLIVVDDVATNKYFITFSALDFANATNYAVCIHYIPTFGDQSRLSGRFFMTVNGVLSPWSAVTNPGAENSIAVIDSGQTARVGASLSGTNFFAGNVYSFGFIQQSVPPNFAARIANVERGIGKRNIILSTDNATDAADMGAIATCVALANSGTADLIGVVTDSSNAFAAPAADALLTYYGLQFVPIAAWQGATPGGASSTSLFASDSSTTFKAGIDRTNAKYLSPTTQIVAWLTAAAAGSVDLVFIGFAGPLAAAIVGNEALFGSKIRQVTYQAGDFTDWNTASEFNVRWDAAAYAAFAASLPDTVREVWQPVSTGEAWRTADFAGKSTASHPGARAWNLQFASTTFQEFAWNQVGVLGAIAGPAIFNYSGPAAVSIYTTGTDGVSPKGWTQQDWSNTTPKTYVASYKDANATPAALKTFYEAFRATWLP